MVYISLKGFIEEDLKQTIDHKLLMKVFSDLLRVMVLKHATFGVTMIIIWVTIYGGRRAMYFPLSFREAQGYL